MISVKQVMTFILLKWMVQLYKQLLCCPVLERVDAYMIFFFHRDMKHENIIRYYGAAKEQQGNDLRWIMVLEYCTRTIKQKFVTDPEARVPGRIEIVALRMDAMRDVAEFALQICNALCFLHDRGIVHRDLKSDNILVRNVTDWWIALTDWLMYKCNPWLMDWCAK